MYDGLRIAYLQYFVLPYHKYSIDFHKRDNYILQVTSHIFFTNTGLCRENAHSCKTDVPTTGLSFPARSVVHLVFSFRPQQSTFLTVNQ